MAPAPLRAKFGHWDLISFMRGTQVLVFCLGGFALSSTPREEKQIP